jgi:hypothetical protein
MKLYAHLGETVHIVSIGESQTIRQLSDRLCQLLNLSQLRLSKFKGSPEIGPDVHVATFFDDMDDVWITKAEESKEPSRHLEPLAALQYTSLTKYSFYEYDSNWVRVEVPFDGIGKHDKAKISCKFDENSFVLTILDFKGKHYQFSVMRLQCKIQADKSKYTVLKDKLRVSLRKVNENDNWFSLFKTKTIGGDD